MGRRLVLGDIHGQYDYLVDVFKKANVDFENDLIIQIGDIVDRGPEPFTCMDLLMKFKNRVFITGNHDQAFIMLVAEGKMVLGRDNGVEQTVRAWNLLTREEQFKYLDTFFREQVSYHVTGDNICFVHGGFDRTERIEEQTLTSLCWDRELIQKAMSCTGDTKLITVDGFKEIFVGHTPTIYWNETIPIYKGGIWNIDTGSGKGGPLTLMDVDTKEYWQSFLWEKDRQKLKSYGIKEKIENPTSQSQGGQSGESQEEAQDTEGS